jgi:hypothetical protein
LFRSCLRKDQESAKSWLNMIEKTHPDTVPIVPLAVLAAQNGLPSILQLCIDKGVKFDRFLARACAVAVALS